jgi:hypothetical protein
MVIASGTEGFKYTALKDIEERYEEIGSRHARNYGWYQSRWHAAAGQIYDSGGEEALVRMWRTFLEQQEQVNDHDFAEFLSTRIHPSVADVLLRWDD